MNLESVIFAGGIYNIILVIFHLTFWKLFKWKKDLARITFINRAVMQVLNLSLTFVFLIFAYISIFHAQELISTNLGNSLLLLISVFWFLRAIEQTIFFGLKNVISVMFFLFFLLGSIIYLYPFLKTINT
ncbi:MAG: hypothetical protein KJO12_01285 [Ignavibacteria bacterium]|nr:hypothetical protein [Ignavibacteria bacterium]